MEVVERKGDSRCKSWRPHRTDGQGFGVFGLQVRVASDRGENRIAQLGKTGWNARGLTVLVDHGRWRKAAPAAARISCGQPTFRDASEQFRYIRDAECSRVVGANLERRHQLPIKTDLVVRSEEHTSELQSLMLISYAVFCLKKKK